MGIQDATPNAWVILATVLPPEQLDRLASLILETLQQDDWGAVKIEVREHRIHALSVERSQLIRRPGD